MTRNAGQDALRSKLQRRPDYQLLMRAISPIA